ncbi:MAG: hypothetical protein OEU54_08965 [Gemmatimonadota bacterium]|nr:hypothetical protein [Gemmatimonadota bacterium]
MDAHVTDPAGNGATLATRLDDVERRVPVPRIADVWLFPPLPDVVDSSEFLLFTAILEGETRALFSARLVPENGSPAHQVIIEHGTAPADRLPRLVSNLQQRLGQPLPARHIPIAGEPDRWRRLVEETREMPGGGRAPDGDH